MGARAEAGPGDPPPPPDLGLRLRRDGRFEHEGREVTHPRLHAALRRGVRPAPDGGFLVTLGRFRARLEVEDTPWFVEAYDAATGRIRLSDGTEEPLAVGSLRAGPDGALCCRVKEGRWEARFEREAQAELLAAIEEREGVVGLLVRGQWRPLPAALLADL